MPKTVGTMGTPEPLLTIAQMAAVDAAAVSSGVIIDTLMNAAGTAVADATPPGLPVAVLCGPGNNGGDGYVAARILRERGADVCVYADGQPKRDSAAARAVLYWQGAVRVLADFMPSANMVVIDALYGAGLSRPIDGAAAEAIARLNASGATVLAVDVPSGLHGDNGQTLGPVVHANSTVTFVRAKPGHLLWPGRMLCGELVVADIGIQAIHLAASSPSIFRNNRGLWEQLAPQPSPDGHKYQRGHCLVISGPELQTGASRLSAQAALHAGAGAVSLAGEREALLVHAAHVTAIMLREAPDPPALQALLEATRFASAIIGPAASVTPRTAGMIDVLLASGLPLVLDADAVTVLVGQHGRLANRLHLSPLVLTPHSGEFGRLFGDMLASDRIYADLPRPLQASKVEMARAAARLVQGVVVFKGIDTVIAEAGGRAAINTNAGPELATAGSGDVLAGLIASHLAQGMPAFEAAAAGVWLHGACAAAYGIGLTADRLVNLIRPLATVADAPA